MVNYIKLFKGITVDRDILMLARHTYDLYVTAEGSGANFVWKRNDFRIKFLHNFTDFIKRNGRKSKTTDQLIAADERNFFFSYEEIQGVVYDSHRKEIIMLGSQEELRIHFRSLSKFNAYIALLKERINTKMFSRDDTQIPLSITLGAKK